MMAFKDYIIRLKVWLGSLSFRTGVVVALCCVLFYAISFAQMLLPISVAAKGVIWAAFFGLAKAAQYSAILILGTTGVKRIRQYFKSSRQTDL